MHVDGRLFELAAQTICRIKQSVLDAADGLFGLPGSGKWVASVQIMEEARRRRRASSRRGRRRFLLLSGLSTDNNTLRQGIAGFTQEIICVYCLRATKPPMSASPVAVAESENVAPASAGPLPPAPPVIDGPK